MSSSRNLRAEPDSPSNVAGEPGGEAAFVSTGGSPEVYNEAAFRYFLSIERERSERSGRLLLLLLVDLGGESGRKTRMTGDEAEKVFQALDRCVRETDFIGWYQEDRTVGAVLTQRSKKPTLETATRTRDRVLMIVNEQLPESIARRIQVRLYQLPVGLKGRRTSWR